MYCPHGVHFIQDLMWLYRDWFSITFRQKQEDKAFRISLMITIFFFNFLSPICGELLGNLFRSIICCYFSKISKYARKLHHPGSSLPHWSMCCFPMSCFYFSLIFVFLHFSIMTSVSYPLFPLPQKVNKTTKNLVAIIMFWAMDHDSLHFYSRKTCFLDSLSSHIYNITNGSFVWLRDPFSLIL